MTTAPDIARHAAAVNALMRTARKSSSGLLELANSGMSPRELEMKIWECVQEFGQTLMSMGMATLCKRATERELEARGLGPQDVRLRLDKDYTAHQMSTFGPIEFPLFAFRERNGACTVTRTPARAEVVPILSKCRSTPLCLEWEAKLGKDLPFRKAADALEYFTHGAVHEEDTTVAAHTVAVGSVVGREWLYRPLPKIRQILDERAARDKESGLPVVYLSQDAHAERRFVDDTWLAAWKSMNGLRIWCVDARNGGIIHLGGEYTWGDCHKVGLIIEELIAEGILPRDGDYGDGLRAQLVIVTDGLPWIEDHVVGKLPWAHVVLDLYHALEHLADFAAAVCGAGTREARALYERLAAELAPLPTRKATKLAVRKGHKKGTRQAPVHDPADYGNIWKLLCSLYAARDEFTQDERSVAAFWSLVGYLESNAYRGDYDRSRARGLQIGSGAMESLHRTAAQLRLKLAGARWTLRTSLALVNLRLLELAGRWDEFWRRADLPATLAQAFENTVDLGT